MATRIALDVTISHWSFCCSRVFIIEICFLALIEFLVLPEACKEYFEIKDDFERTFMHLAAISGNYECLKLFIGLDCDKNPKDYLKKYTLM